MLQMAMLDTLLSIEGKLAELLEYLRPESSRARVDRCSAAGSVPAQPQD
jgi:hypothetical protein